MAPNRLPAKSLIIGVSGGSGSGKTTYAQELLKKLGDEKASLIYQDSYYFDQSHRFKGDGSVNFDHPDAIDWKCLEAQLLKLKSGESIEIPIYDFATHTRLKRTQSQSPKSVIIIDGILILTQEVLRDLMDLRVYVHTDEPVRFERRLERDVKERGRTPEGVRAQYDKFVRPMHDQFVEPSRIFADLEVSGEENFGESIDSVMKWISQTL